MNKTGTRLRKIGFFLLLVSLLSANFYFRYATPPFAAIPSRSMEPLFKIGTLILVEPVSAANVQTGDIIVVKVPRQVQDRYNYPATIVHRVVKVNLISDQLSFRVKGDNNEYEDPFSVLPEQVMGTVKKAVPYAGFPILFFYSKQGYYFLLSLILIYLLYIVMDEIDKRKQAIKRGASSVIFGEILARIDRLEEQQKQMNDLMERLVESIPLYQNDAAVADAPEPAGPDPAVDPELVEAEEDAGLPPRKMRPRKRSFWRRRSRRK